MSDADIQFLIVAGSFALGPMLLMGLAILVWEFFD